MLSSTACPKSWKRNGMPSAPSTWQHKQGKRTLPLRTSADPLTPAPGAAPSVGTAFAGLKIFPCSVGWCCVGAAASASTALVCATRWWKSPPHYCSPGMPPIGLTAAALVWCGFSAVLLALALIDWDTTPLPDSMTLPLLWVGLMATTLGWTGINLLDAVWGRCCGLFIAVEYLLGF